MAIIDIGAFYIQASNGRFIKRIAQYNTVDGSITGQSFTLPYAAATSNSGDLLLNKCEGFDKYIFTASNFSPLSLHDLICSRMVFDMLIQRIHASKSFKF